MNKLYSILPSFLFLALLLCVNTYSTTPNNSTHGFGFDMSNEQAEQNYFIITQEAITTQKDETQLEAQRLSAQAEFNLKKEIKQTYFNELWVHIVQRYF